SVTTAVYLTVYVPGTVPAGSVHSRPPVQANSAELPCTAPNARPVPSVSVTTRSAVSCEFATVTVTVQVISSPTDTGPAVSAVFAYVTAGGASGWSVSQSSHVPTLGSTLLLTLSVASTSTVVLYSNV